MGRAMGGNNGFVVNIFGGMGAGKTTLAAGLFYRMKSMDMSAHLLLSPYPNLSSVEQGIAASFDVQSRGMHMRAILDAGTKFVVTNNPVVGALMSPNAEGAFKDYVKELFSSFRNINIFVKGKNPKTVVDEERVLEMLAENGVNYTVFGAGFPDPEGAAPLRMLKIVSGIETRISEKKQGGFCLGNSCLVSRNVCSICLEEAN